MAQIKNRLQSFTKVALIAAYTLTSLTASQTVSAGQTPKTRKDIIKLVCSGLYDEWILSVFDIPVSGVYVIIDGDLAHIYNIGGFPEYQTGMIFDVYSRNPSKIWMRNRNNSNIIATINRISGDIHVSEIAPSNSRMLKMFRGKCINPKPVF